MPKTNDKAVKILVSGDVVVDNHVYIGGRKAPDMAGRGTCTLHEWGGAKLAEGILKAFAELPETVTDPLTIAFGLKLPKRPCLYSKERGLSGPDTCPDLHCYATWEPMTSLGEKKVWRVREALGYGGCEGAFYDFAPSREDPSWRPDILVMEDAALGFRFKLDGNPKTGSEYVKARGRNSHFAWPALLESGTGGRPRWIIVKMARPLCSGDLWTTLTKPLNRKRLVVVVSVNDIRRGSVQVSRGCSWERTALDLVRELLQNPSLRRLLQCKHLIITLHSEGALWVKNASSTRRSFHLVLDPGHQEGEWKASGHPGTVLGYTSCMTASLAGHLALETARVAPDDMLKTGIQNGLSAMRTLFYTGHGSEDIGTPGFPFEEVARAIAKPKGNTYSIVAVSPKVAVDVDVSEHWSILGDTEYENLKLNWPLIGVARRVAMFGLGQLRGAPHAAYGKFQTADRGEIEALQNLRRIIDLYVNGLHQKRPLNIAVFGPPGSGKSFAVKELAQELLPEGAETLTFNLSQFTSREDLTDAFHQVRDAILKGNLPLVFWDEFDTDNLAWLKSFLAPMQDGEFTEGQSTHYIGRCVFVFAGGTRESFKAFISRDGRTPNHEGKTEDQLFREKKGPDFVSRLSGYLNVRGVNPASVSGVSGVPCDDLCYPIRRAAMIRSMLGLKGDTFLDIDRDVLTALLATIRYTNGSRSLSKLVHYLQEAGPGYIAPSHLPPRDTLALFVEDVDDFRKHLKQSASFAARAAMLAPGIHEVYRRNEKQANRVPNWDLPFDKLPVYIQQDNIAAAERIIDLLAIIGLSVLPATPANRRHQVSDDIVIGLLTCHINTLAQQEHVGWVAQKRIVGYQYAPRRDEPRRRHDAMLSYELLSEKNKCRDINSVLTMLEQVRGAKHIIVPLSQS